MLDLLIDATFISGASTAVTAIATIALFVVTAVLAKETRRLANLSSQPQVVATIQRNRWGFGFADLHVANTGNAAAFDIQVSFDPPLEIDPVGDDATPPLQSVSVLKPGQAVDSYLVEFQRIIDQTYAVTISWKNNPKATRRETLVYTLRIADIKGSSQLGASDPAVQIADDIRKMREDLHKLTTGWSKPKVDVFTSADRQAERDKRQREMEERRAARLLQPPPPQVRRGAFQWLMALLGRTLR